DIEFRFYGRFVGTASSKPTVKPRWTVTLDSLFGKNKNPGIAFSHASNSGVPLLPLTSRPSSAAPSVAGTVFHSALFQAPNGSAAQSVVTSSCSASSLTGEAAALATDSQGPDGDALEP
ncbi:MAG: hypothetical protein K0U12_02740, partial [Gammaproteobacteria bacterium]|nr:hypothetical protein [Gammaproteobacteria bacterium]